MGHIYNRSPTRSPSRFATSTFETTKIVTSNEHIDKIDKISGVVQRVNVNLNLFSKIKIEKFPYAFQGGVRLLLKSNYYC